MGGIPWPWRPARGPHDECSEDALLKVPALSLRVIIILVMVLLLAAYASATLWVTYSKGQEAALLAAERLITNVGEAVHERVDLTFRPIINNAYLASNWPAASRTEASGAILPESFLYHLLETFPYIYSVYVGRNNGDFHQMLSLKGLVSHQALNFRPPPDAAVAIRNIRRLPDGSRIERWTFQDPAQRIVGRRETREPTYDPRARPWYQQALRSSEIVTTPPYRYASIQRVGVTLAHHVSDSPGAVFGIDILLHSISRFMEERRFSDSAKLLIFSDLGVLVALADGANIPVQEGTASLFGAPDPVLGQFYRELLARNSPDDELMRFGVNGVPWFAKVTPMPQSFGSGFRLAVMAPASDFTGPFTEISDQTLWTLLVILLLTMLLALLLARRITSPLVAVAENTVRIAHLDFSGRNPEKSFVAEVDKLVQATQIMERQLATFVRYVPRTLVQALIDSHIEPQLGGSRRTVTIMFTDVANFSTMSENLAPVDLMRKISAYYDVLATQIGSHAGLIQKFLGDGLMGLWNTPSLDQQHVRNACNAALGCRVATNRLNADWLRWGWYPMHTRIGLHMGEVAVGNVGTVDRMDYTAVGVAVNLASRLEGLNKVYGTQILCSESVRAAVADEFLFRSLDQVIPQGLGQPIGIHELIGVHPAVGQAADPGVVATEAQLAYCNAWESAYALYLRRDWHGANERFSALAMQQPEDPVVRLYLERARQFSQTPPPPDWNGVSVLTEK